MSFLRIVFNIAACRWRRSTKGIDKAACMACAIPRVSYGLT
jgi:hypothetical protein